MSAPISLAELRAKVTGGELTGDYLTDEEGLALVEAVEAAQAYIAKYDSEPRLTTADLNPYSTRGLRATLRKALERFGAAAGAQGDSR